MADFLKATYFNNPLKPYAFLADVVGSIFSGLILVIFPLRETTNGLFFCFLNTTILRY
ncbi:hypothetical protein MNBD_BACTEROID06-999, partial [hydrothermal vent metagenome]